MDAKRGPFSFLMVCLVPALLTGSPAGRATTPCPPYERCYCEMKPDDCGALVSAEIMAVDEDLVTFRVLGTPHIDVAGVLRAGQEISAGLHQDLAFEPGQTVLLRLADAPGACSTSAQQEPFIFRAIVEEDGLYPCSTAPGFEGASLDQVVAAIKSDDCRAAVGELGIDVYCEDYDTGCSSQGGRSTPRGFLVFLAGVIFSSTVRKRA